MATDDFVFDADEPPINGLTHRAGGNRGVPLEDGFNGNGHTNGEAAENGSVESENEELDPIQLPQSTHSLLFSQPVFSIPFAFALGIMLLSFTCLGLAFVNSRQSGSIPVNVTSSVKIAQYMSIVIALLMEEEIPTGLYLLRMIPQQSLHQKFPRMKYSKFVLSSCIRILNGYFFLANVIVVLVYSTGVLDIFYDVLALQFVQQLDDIAFALAKMDMFGKRLQRACTAKCFRAEFGQQRLGRNKNVSRVLKGLTVLNFAGMLAVMTSVTEKQMNGEYQVGSISVKFGTTVWSTAWANMEWLDNSTGYEQRSLVYSFFNGVYIKNGTESGRPVYWEARKFDDQPYEWMIPASFQYCEEISAWVFMHQHIKKSKSKSSETGCRSNWLLRSPETDGFDILSVTSGWQVWVGTIGNAVIDLVSNECKDESDCNLHGVCNSEGQCDCEEKDDVRYLGTHCEVDLPNSCETIIGEFYNESYQVQYLRALSETWQPNQIELAYSRPMYTELVSGGNLTSDNFTAFNVVAYLGDRWYFSHFNPANLLDLDPVVMYFWFVVEMHAFWFNLLADQDVWIVSDPTTSSTPVGVDFYFIVDRSEQSGVRGALKPIQPDGITGKGYFRCGGPANNTAVTRKLQTHNVIDHHSSE